MSRFAMKALLTALTFDRAERKKLSGDRTVLLFSTLVTVGLVALYGWGKVTARW